MLDFRQLDLFASAYFDTDVYWFPGEQGSGRAEKS